MTVTEILSLLGDRTTDIHVNGTTYWRNIPSNVWRFTVGGYQIIKKWLSYRESALLARDMTFRDIASMHGSYRKVEETIPALQLIGQTLIDCGVERSVWYFDQPVSNSGRLKTILRELAQSVDCGGRDVLSRLRQTGDRLQQR